MSPLFVKSLTLLAKPAGSRQKSAAGLFDQRQFSARKKDATKDHGLQKPALARDVVTRAEQAAFFLGARRRGNKAVL
jgi:hypothetical protein